MEQFDLRRLDPRRFETYRNDLSRCFCQVRLDSGERVLVSGAQGAVKLVKLALGGLIPAGTIATLSSAQLAELFRPMLADASYPFQHPLDMTAMMVAGMPSVSDIKSFLATDAGAQRVVVTAALEAAKRAQAQWRAQHGEFDSKQS